MIDPNILLQSKPVSIETPNDAAIGAQTLTNLGNTGQIQQGTIAQQAATVAGTEQENQQRQIALDNQKATNLAIQQNITTGPDGKPAINHAGVVQSLTQAGKGVAALDYQKNATAIQQGVVTLQEANQKLQQAHTESVASVAGAVDQATTPQAKAAIYAMGIHSLIANHQIQPGDMPDTYDPSMDAKIKGWATMGQTSEQQTQNVNAANLAKATQQRADVLVSREQDYSQHLDQQDKNSAAANAVANRRADIAQQNADTLANKLGGLTPNGQGVQDRADQKTYAVDRAKLDGLHVQRTALGTALAVQNGEAYNDPKTGKPAGEMNDQVRAGLQAQFDNATNEGKRIMSDMGIANEFADQKGGSTPAAAAPATPAPTPATPKAAPAAAAPAAAAPAGKYKEGDILTNPQTKQRIKLVNNVWKQI